MVLDHIDRVAYAARSRRADAVALERFCTHFNFEPMAFDTADAQGRSVYHTNVLMCGNRVRAGRPRLHQRCRPALNPCAPAG